MMGPDLEYGRGIVSSGRSYCACDAPATSIYGGSAVCQACRAHAISLDRAYEQRLKAGELAGTPRFQDGFLARRRSSVDGMTWFFLSLAALGFAAVFVHSKYPGALDQALSWVKERFFQ